MGAALARMGSSRDLMRAASSCGIIQGLKLTKAEMQFLSHLSENVDTNPEYGGPDFRSKQKYLGYQWRTLMIDNNSFRSTLATNEGLF